MVKKLLFGIFFFAFFIACNPPVLEIENDSDYDWKKKLISINEPFIDKLDFDKNNFFTTIKGDTLSHQWIDDELIVGLNLKSGGSLKIQKGVGKLPSSTLGTQVHLGYAPNKDYDFRTLEFHQRPKDHIQSIPPAYQCEGPVWESEYVAFRSYFDKRNGKDIFGKLRPSIVAQKIGKKQNYHELQEWGMDVLKVGNSLGAGAIAIKKNDSIFRLGNTESSIFQKEYQGPLEASFKLLYKGWNVKDVSYDITERISIQSGRRWYKNDITLSGGSFKDTLVTGIVDKHGLQLKTIDWKDYIVVYTHGAQSYLGDFLGMAIIIEKDGFYGISQAPKEGEGVIESHLVLLKKKEGIYSYRFCAGWEKEDERFKSEEFFVNFLKLEIDQLTSIPKVDLPKGYLPN